MLTLLALLASPAMLPGSASSTTTPIDPYFPVFHVRPPAGHVNDPNGPFYDQTHGLYHLFMQYHPYDYPTGITWGHFTSANLSHWAFRGIAIDSDGNGCPNTGGVFTGSAVTVADGSIPPTIVYPGVHTVPKSPAHPDGIGMAQCLARPVDPTGDPFLTNWTSEVGPPFLLAPLLPRSLARTVHYYAVCLSHLRTNWNVCTRVLYALEYT